MKTLVNNLLQQTASMQRKLDSINELAVSLDKEMSSKEKENIQQSLKDSRMDNILDNITLAAGFSYPFGCCVYNWRQFDIRLVPLKELHAWTAPTVPYQRWKAEMIKDFNLLPDGIHYIDFSPAGFFAVDDNTDEEHVDTDIFVTIDTAFLLASTTTDREKLRHLMSHLAACEDYCYRDDSCAYNDLYDDMERRSWDEEYLNDDEDEDKNEQILSLENEIEELEEEVNYLRERLSIGRCDDM